MTERTAIDDVIDGVEQAKMNVEVKSVIGDKINLLKLKENQSKIRQLIDSDPSFLDDELSPMPIMQSKPLPREIIKITNKINRQRNIYKTKEKPIIRVVELDNHHTDLAIENIHFRSPHEQSTD